MHALKPKIKSKCSRAKTNKTTTTIKRATKTKRTRLENKAAEIKMKTMRQYVTLRLMHQVLRKTAHQTRVLYRLRLM